MGVYSHEAMAKLSIWKNHKLVLDLCRSVSVNTNKTLSNATQVEMLDIKNRTNVGKVSDASRISQTIN